MRAAVTTAGEANREFAALGCEGARLLPVVARGGEVFALESGAAGKRERLQIFRIELQGLRDQPVRLTGGALALQHGEHVGAVGKQLRIVRRKRDRASESAVGIGKALQRGVRAREHGPALQIGGRVGRRFFQTLCEGHEHRLHGFGRDLGVGRGLRGSGRGLRVQAGRVADRSVERDREQRHREADEQQCFRRTRYADGNVVGDRFVEHAALQLAARRAVLRRVDQPFGVLAVERGELLAQDAQVRRLRARVCQRRPPCGQQHPNGQRGQAGGADRENHHGRAMPLPSNSARRCDSASLSSGGGASRRRRQMFAASTNAASASSANGPTHSSAVVGLNAGR